MDLKIETPESLTYERSGFKSEVTGVGTVTRIMSLSWTASFTDEVIFHLGFEIFGIMSSTSGSPVGFSPFLIMRNVLSEISTPQTLNPDS